MKYEISYELSDELMRMSTRRAFAHHLNWRVPLYFVLLLLLLIPLCASDPDGYLCGMGSGAILVLALMVVILYAVRNTRALRAVRKLETRSARCEVTDEGLRIENALANSFIKWGLVEKVVQAPDVWLFFFSREQYFALPAAKLAGGAGEFIAGRVSRSK